MLGRSLRPFSVVRRAVVAARSLIIISMIMNHLMIKHPCLRIVMGFIVTFAVKLVRLALAQDHAPLAHESSSGEHLKELEDIMKKMGKTLKAICSTNAPTLYTATIVAERARMSVVRIAYAVSRIVF